MSDQDYLAMARQGEADWLALRRHFHQYPELSNQESRTAARCAEWLRDLGLETRTGIAGTHGVLATLDSGKPGPTILLRGDMDALPIEENNSHSFASAHSGVMHACGHDVHTTCVLGAARLLHQTREQLKGRVLFLLQPAEELPPGGAKVMVEEGGILEGVDAAAALHVFHGVHAGQLGFQPGTMLANTARFEIRVRGVGGHAAMPHQTVDAVAVGVQIYQALQYLVSRENNPLSPLVITTGSFHGGNAPNVIAGETILKGTTRCLEDALSEKLPEMMERVIAGVCQATRAEYEFNYLPGYPALHCDPELTEWAITRTGWLLGEENIVRMGVPVMGGEDFSYIAREVPSIFFWLGIRNEEKGIIHPVHSPQFDIDESAIPLGVAALAQLAADYLREKA